MAKKPKVNFKQLVRDKLKFKTVAKPTEINTMIRIDPKGSISIKLEDGRTRVIAKTDMPFETLLKLLEKKDK
ncbi:MAG: hypothetical protein DRJ01_00355 [Bacteroidetes bacterium]|nr:MAG: hypothetical protein DRJ01_00355 [Bacteroidota bacterium]